jgi:hypothetical protein
LRQFPPQHVLLVKQLEAFDAGLNFVVPLSWPAAAENPQGRYGVGIQLFGRLKPGVTARQADAEAKTLEKRSVDAGPRPLKAFVERSGMTMNVGGVQEQRVQPVRPTLLVLQGGVAFVLAHRLFQRRESPAGAPCAGIRGSSRRTS